MSSLAAPGFRPRFFIPEVEAADVAPGRELALTPADSHHAQRVLRLASGDECEVVVGAAVYAASVVAGETVRVRLERRLEGAEAGAAYRFRVGLVQALVRPAALDTVLEKATEVGCSFFLLFPAAGSPRWADARRDDRVSRWARIVGEAAKQSKQVAVPEVTALASIEKAVRHLGEMGARSVVLDPRAPAALTEILAVPGSPKEAPRVLALWVGPEGGWHGAETDRFDTAGLARARLGRGVLRTETAGPVAVAVSRLALGDW